MSNFWNGFNFGFTFGMLRSNPFFGCFNNFNFFPSFNFNCFTPFPIFPAAPDCSGGFNFRNSQPVFYSIFDAPPAIPNLWNFDVPWHSQNGLSDSFNSSNSTTETHINPSNKFITENKAFSAKSPPSLLTNSVKKSTSAASVTSTKSNSVSRPAGQKCTLDNDTLDKLQKYLRSKEGDGTYTVKNDSGGTTNKGVTHGTYDEYRRKHGLPLQHVSKMSHEEYLKIIKWIWELSGADKETNPRMAFYRFALKWGGCSRFDSIVSQSGGDPDKFEQLRRNYYYSISKPGSKNHVFRNGWQNRVTWDKEFAEKNFPDMRAT